MTYDAIQTFSQNLVNSMTAEQLTSYHRHTFIAKFTHPDFRSYSDLLELVDSVDFYVVARIANEASEIAA